MTWYHRLPGMKPRQPLRVGELNTGELVLVDDAGHAQVLSKGTTDLARLVLRRETSGTAVFAWQPGPLPVEDTSRS